MTNLTPLIERVEAASEWRAVPGWPYEASDTGVIRSTRTGKALSVSVSASGYERVSFQVDCVRRDVRVHRAICEAWFGPIPDGMVVNHKDADKRNNRPDNLEVVTHAQNMQHSVSLGLHASGARNGAHTMPERRRRGSENGSSKLTEADVIEIRAARERGVSLSALARQFGVDKSLIGQISRRVTWTHI